MAAPRGQELDSTRIEGPRPRLNDIERPDLVDQLPGGQGASRITTISAPAGWGKSTLLGQWIAGASSSIDIAYLAVDEADNDPLRFLQYVCAALNRAAPDLRVDGTVASTSLWIDTVLPDLGTAIAGRARPVAIAVDDYHLVASPDVHRLVRAVIDAVVDNCFVVVAGRADPPLPLARLRAARDVTDLRLADLAFTAADSRTLLDSAFRIDLGADAVAALHETTEGWPAGVCLAGLSIGSAGDPDAMARHLGGRDRHLADFFAEEVLDSLDSEVVHVLTCTSVLDRFNAELTEAVTGRSDGRRMIEELERRQLFVIPLDPAGRWFRYHHLMADLLRVELRRRATDEERAELHRRAASWLVDDGQLRAGIEHLFEAGAHDRAAELILANGYAMAYGDRAHTVAAWCDRFPDDTIDANPDICMLGVFTRRNLAQDPRAWEWLDRYEAAISTPTPLQQLAVLDARTWLSYASGRLLDAAAFAEQILALRPELDDPGNPEATAAGDVLNGILNAGLVLSQVGDERAAGLLGEVLAISTSSTSIDLQQEAAAGSLAIGHWHRHEDDQAASMVELARRRRGDRQPQVFSLPWMIAAVLLDPTGTDDAFIDRLSAIGERFSNPYALALIHMAEATYLQAAGRAADASIAAAQARELLDPVERSVSADGTLARVSDLLGPERPQPARGPVELTDRERQVLGALAGPLTQREIGAELYLSFNTVKTYTRSLYRKLGVQSRSEAVHLARELALLPG